MREILATHFYDRALRSRLNRLFDMLHGPWLAAFCWVLIVAVGFSSFRGRDSLLQVWPFMVVALVGAVSIGAVTAWWTSRLRPTILVARFVAVPDDDENTQTNANVFREAIKRVLHSARTRGNSFTLAELPLDIDPHDDRQIAIARNRAREERAAIVVTGKVVTDGQTVYRDVIVVTHDDQSRLRPPDRADVSGGQERGQHPTVVPEKVTIMETRDETASAAASAQMALGITFLTRGSTTQAMEIFSHIRPRSALSAFYESYSAYLSHDFERAATRAKWSFETRAWVPAAAVASLAFRELGDRDAAKQYLEPINQQTARAEDEEEEWDERFRVLGLVAQLSEAKALFDDSVGYTLGAVETVQLAVREAQRSDAYRDAIWALHRNPPAWPRILQLLEPYAGDFRSDEAALYALASVRMSRQDREARVREATSVLKAEAPDSRFPYGHLAAAYAYLDTDPEVVASYWRGFIERSNIDNRTERQITAEIFLGGDSANRREIVAITNEATD